MLLENQSPSSPNKAGLLTPVPKEGAPETCGKRSPEFDGFLAGGAENWSSQLLLRMCSSSSLFARCLVPASRGGRMPRPRRSLPCTRRSLAGPARRMCTAGESLVGGLLGQVCAHAWWRPKTARVPCRWTPSSSGSRVRSAFAPRGSQATEQLSCEPAGSRKGMWTWVSWSE